MISLSDFSIKGQWPLHGLQPTSHTSSESISIAPNPSASRCAFDAAGSARFAPVGMTCSWRSRAKISPSATLAAVLGIEFWSDIQRLPVEIPAPTEYLTVLIRTLRHRGASPHSRVAHRTQPEHKSPPESSHRQIPVSCRSQVRPIGASAESASETRETPGRERGRGRRGCLWKA